MPKVRWWSLALLAAASCGALAQSYPAKPVFLVLPYTAGGGMGNFVVAIAQRMSESWGQQVHVDYRPGANAIIGTQHVVKSSPDGYTLLISDPSLINNALLRKLAYDPIKDLAPVIPVVRTDYALSVAPSLGASNVKEFLAIAKAKPGYINFASLGNGSTAHLAAEMLQLMAGVTLNHIPYKGSAQAIVDVSSGQVHTMLISLNSVLPFAKSGKIRLLAITSMERSPKHPDLPTVHESGVPGYELSSWYGVHAPAGTPRAAIERVNAEVRKIVADPAFHARHMEGQGFEAQPITPEQFGAFIRAEFAKWGRIVREAKVSVD
jgi:tripartite-type tricarboxylate transporter receptor subunit TctC